MKNLNPITNLVISMEQKWEEAVNEKIQLVRWLLPKEDLKMFEVYARYKCAAKNTEDINVGLRTPFEDPRTFSVKLVNDWIARVQKKEKELQRKGFQVKNWADSFRLQQMGLKDKLKNQVLQETCKSFSKYMNTGATGFLNLFIVPHTVSDTMEMDKWLTSVFEKGLPSNCRLIICDHMGEEYYRYICKKYPQFSETITQQLNYPQAQRDMALMGKPEDPEVFLRECIFQMGDAVKDKDEDRVNHWGKEALKSAHKTENVHLQGASYIAYAGMLLNFKYERDNAEELLIKADEIIEEKVQQNDNSCQHMRMQIMSLRASCCALRKDYFDAADWCVKQGEYAREIGLIIQAVSAFRLGAKYVEKRSNKQARDCMKKAFDTGKNLGLEDQKYSDFRFVALEYYNELRLSGQKEDAEKVNNDMQQIFGRDWMKKVEQEMEKSRKPEKVDY